eukprot:2208250-Rhodomonas_salina.1
MSCSLVMLPSDTGWRVKRCIWWPLPPVLSALWAGFCDAAGLACPSLLENVALLASFRGGGKWKTDTAFRLETSAGEYPVWTGTAVLQCGFALEYKYIIVKKGDVVWENGPVNRSLRTSLEMMVVNDGWFNGIRENVQTAPVASEQELTPKPPSGKSQEVQPSAKGDVMSNNGVVIVASVLPLTITRKGEGKFDIEWDYRKAAAKLRNPKRSFKYVGWVGLEIPEAEQAALKERLVG